MAAIIHAAQRQLEKPSGWLCRRSSCWAVLAVIMLNGSVLAGDDGPSKATGEQPSAADKPAEAVATVPMAPKLDLQGQGIEDRARLRSFQENEWEAKAYCNALITARYTSVEALANSARHDLTYAHLFTDTCGNGSDARYRRS